MVYNITHTTEYTYFDPVSLCHNIARLLPRNTTHQRCLNAQIDILPVPDRLNEYEDFYGNKLIYFSIEKEHRRLVVRVRSKIEKRSRLNVQSYSENKMAVEDIKQFLLTPGPESAEIRQYVFETPMTTSTHDIQAYSRISFIEDRSVWESIIDLMHRIYTDFEFKPGFTTISTPLIGCYGEKKRRMPGFCAPCNCLHSFRRVASQIYQRIYRNSISGRKRQAHGC